jgi:hypothetical protein
MNQQSATLYVSASNESFWLIVEPWADEFEIHPQQRCRVVAKHPHLTPSFEAELVQGKLVVYVNEPGCTYELWRGDMLELSMTVPIPGAS